jgi:protein-tyrosine phosphatase
MRSLVREAGLEGEIEADSAGIGGWHAGDAPDRRSAAAARARGIALDGAARQVRSRDFETFDLILACDRTHLRDLRAMAPAGARGKVRLLREYDPGAEGDLDVPDPYYGGEDGFEDVLDMVDAACRGLLDELA